MVALLFNMAAMMTALVVQMALHASGAKDSDGPYVGLSIEVDRKKVHSAEKGLSIEVPMNMMVENAIDEINTSTTRNPKVQMHMDKRYRRVYNPDEVADIEEFPYMAALLVNNELWCGAVVIDNDKVLTAAHCLQLQYNNRFFREYVKMLSVRVGSNNATSGGDLYYVSEISFHPNYKPQSLEFNFAVLKLHRNLTVGARQQAVRSIAYTRDKVIPIDKEITFLGWGSVLGINGAGGQVLLQKVKLPIYDTADCQEVYGSDLVTRTNFCAGFITIPKNVCNHDAGGPAIMDGKLVGILSFSSKRCDLPDQPAVFSSVGAIADWIDRLEEKEKPMRNQIKYMLSIMQTINHLSNKVKYK